MTDRARELLGRALFALESTAYFDKQPLDGKPLAEEIRAYLAEPEQDEEPVAWTNRQEINALNEECTVYMYAEPMEGEDNIPLYLHPAPRKPFVRLSEEKIMAIVRADPDFDEMMWDKTAVRFARAIEDALEEANRYKPFVRLTEEEVSEILSSAHTPYEAICAAENRLERKNK